MKWKIIKIYCEKIEQVFCSASSWPQVQWSRRGWWHRTWNESCSLAPRLEYNNAESILYFCLGIYVCVWNVNYQESESLIKGLRASNHSSSPLRQIMFCLETFKNQLRIDLCRFDGEISCFWEECRKCWKYCAWGSLRSDRRKESKSLRGKISFHSNYSSSVQVPSSISNLLKSSPVNRPIFLRAKTHPSSVATSPELIKSVMAMAKLSMLVARRVKLMILVTH